MSIEGDLKISAQTILDLPIESLALAVLENFSSSDSWNRRNWLLGAESLLERGEHISALSEAWAWLEARCLVACDHKQSSSDAIFVTRAGKKALELNSIDEVVAAERIGLNLHPSLEGKIMPIFLLGDYETAAFKAMKEVEVRVREISGLPKDLIGVKLMRAAFSPKDGSLKDTSLENGEIQARADLFAGAIGSFKNPTSHRPVEYSDPAEASEVVLLADLLMRILDSIEVSLKSQGAKAE